MITVLKVKDISKILKFIGNVTVFVKKLRDVSEIYPYFNYAMGLTFIESDEAYKNRYSYI